MANYRRALVADLKMVWEQNLAKLPGVEADPVRLDGLVHDHESRPLQRAVRPYRPGDPPEGLPSGRSSSITARLGPGRSRRGLPVLRWRSEVPRTGPRRSVGSPAVEALAFRENGYFLEEYDRIFTSHFGRNPDFRKIVAALAARPQGLFRQELVRVAGVARAVCSPSIWPTWRPPVSFHP